MDRRSAVFFLLCFLECACTCSETSTAEIASKSSNAARTPDPSPPSAQVRTLLEIEHTAYGNSLYADGEGFLFLTPSEIIRVDASMQVQRFPVELGPGAQRWGQQILFFRDGSLRQISPSAEDDTPVVELSAQPYILLASDERFAWISKENSRYLVQSVVNSSISTSYQTKQRVVAAALFQDRVYLVESSAGSWRIVSVSLSGKQLSASKERRGRPPSMVVATQEGLYLYAGPAEGVKRLSLGLQAAHTIAKEVTCSPLAVSNRVVCAQLGGLVELSRGNQPRIVALESGGPIANVAATTHAAAWIVDSGKNQLRFRVAPLVPRPEGLAPP